MNKVLLIFQKPKKSKFYATILPPMGILYISSYFESKGIKTDVVDCNVQKLNVDFSKYSYIFFSVNISNIENTIETIKKAKKINPALNIMVGGPMTLNKGKHFIKIKEVDAVAIGEGEITAYEYIKSKNKKDVKGLLLKKKKGDIFYTGDRPFIKNLNKLPFPSFHKVLLDRYYLPLAKEKKIGSIITSRGCSFNCIFCFHEHTWRARSPQNVVDEIEWQIKNLGVKELVINDENLTLDINRAKKIFEEINKRNIKIKIQCKGGIRANLINKELLVEMKKSGVWLINFAPETGNEETLKKIRKGFGLNDVKKAISLCNDLGIVTTTNFMVGFPWETKKHLDDTLKFSTELDCDFVKIARVLPIEGTLLYDLMNVKPKRELSDEGIFYGSTKHSSLILKESYIHSFIRKFYLINYTKRIPRIIKILPLKNIIYLIKYAFISKSV